ncbi:MAG: F0F1 ATP synthase subunit gamma [Nevskiaceae bacterium]|nr:MAG: F0F1 ATP synthase subunit gamma [Nevskiaceae bacterium]TBR73566.1 MAG: F0F1 ATP synthase subunit gamma [Nevskiaceae bacterium]
MAGAKEIRTKIRSIQNTQKITKAMEKVATSKMRKAQNRMLAARPYAEKIRAVVGHMKRGNLMFHHPFLAEREVRKVAYLVVATDRGLCGGLNMNLFRGIVRETREWQEKGVQVEFAVIGSKAVSFFRRVGGNVLAEASRLGDSIHIEQLIGVVKVLADAYREQGVDRVYVASNEFVNTMSQKPHSRQLLPVPPMDDEALPKHWDYIYEPNDESLVDSILVRYVESIVYETVVENAACEQAARMVAMKSASDNAGKIIDGLQLAYNKARQASITKELAEIVGGAAAV